MSIENNRHHKERMKQRRRHHWGRELTGAKELGKAVTTPAPCSCWGCGNARRIDGLTRQELRAKK